MYKYNYKYHYHTQKVSSYLAMKRVSSRPHEGRQWKE